MRETFDLLERKLGTLLKEAKKQKKKAKKTKDERYFEGRKEAFKQLLDEMKNLRDGIEPDANGEEGNPAENSVEATPSPDDAKALLNDALAKGVVTRKKSVYFHESFPKGKAQGKSKVLDLLKNEDIAATLQQQVAEAENDHAVEDSTVAENSA